MLYHYCPIKNCFLGPRPWVGDEIYMFFGICQVILKEIIKNNSSFKNSPPENNNLLSFCYFIGDDELLV